MKYALSPLIENVHFPPISEVRKWAAAYGNGHNLPLIDLCQAVPDYPPARSLTDYLATIGLGVDLYDERALIDSIDRSDLPSFRYRFEIGDEVISVDGESAASWIDRISRQQSFANGRATRRWALDQWFYRDQVVMPRAPEIGVSLIAGSLPDPQTKRGGHRVRPVAPCLSD